MSRRVFEWSPGMIEQLRHMRAEGHAYSVIANRLGVTKNAAISKGYALRLPSICARKKGARHRKPDLALIRNAQVRAGADIVRGQAATEVKPRPDEPTPLGIDTACQWLHGEPGKRLFCGHARKPGSSYCEHHAPRTRVPGTSVKDLKVAA